MTKPIQVLFTMSFDVDPALSEKQIKTLLRENLSIDLNPEVSNTIQWKTWELQQVSNAVFQQQEQTV